MLLIGHDETPTSNKRQLGLHWQDFSQDELSARQRVTIGVSASYWIDGGRVVNGVCAETAHVRNDGDAISAK
jgi:hypothetical protein